MIRLRAVLGFCAMSLLSHAQQQAAPELVAIPNRPTVSNPAETTQVGVLEVEYGIEAAALEQMMCGLLKFGATRDLELRLGADPFGHDATAHKFGPGDMTVGAKYRVIHQTNWLPDAAIAYAAKLPTAADLLGSGKMDHQITGLLSKDVFKSHYDFNATYFLLGRSARSGFDHNWLLVFTWAHPLINKFGIAAELSGFTPLNRLDAGSISNLYAVTYTVKPRLVLDSAIAFGLYGAVPAATFQAGFTYSIADLYHHRR